MALQSLLTLVFIPVLVFGYFNTVTILMLTLALALVSLVGIALWWSCSRTFGLILPCVETFIVYPCSAVLTLAVHMCGGEAMLKDWGLTVFFFKTRSFIFSSRLRREHWNVLPHPSREAEQFLKLQSRQRYFLRFEFHFHGGYVTVISSEGASGLYPIAV